MKKHGYPWASMIRLKSIKQDVFEQLTKIAESIDWGVDFSNHRTNPHAIALYESTRKISHSYNKDCDSYPEFSKVAKELYDDVAECFPDEEMMLYHAQLIILLPNSIVEWHNDRALMTYIGTRIIMPINDVPVSYFFSTWKENTPLTDPNFKGSDYINYDTVTEVKSPPIGNYYIYNNRIPHRSVNHSDKPRFIVLMDVTSVREFKEHGCVEGIPPHYYPLTEEEKTAKVLPPML